MRVLLVVPPKRALAKDYMKHVPIGLGYLATTLRKLGHEPDIQDCMANRWTSETLLDYIARTKPGMVGITVFSLAAHSTREILDRIKQRCPAVITIVGGPHVTGDPEQALASFTGADYGVAGEGEVPLTHLLPLLEGGRGKLEDVPGLIWRDGGRIRCNRNVEVDHLDELGFPAWDLLNLPQYFDAPGVGDKATAIHTTRGCPYACAFCVKLGRRLRFHTIEGVYREMKLLHRTYGITHFIVFDEGFAIDPRFAKQFCRYVIAQGNPFSYMAACGLRLNRIDDELCQLLLQARFSPEVPVGIEAGSPRVRELMHKNLPQETIFKSVDTLRKHGFRPIGNFILGYPGETKAEMEQTIDLALQLKLSGAHFTPFIPLPGATATKQLLSQGKLPADFDATRIDLDCILYVPEGMSREEMEAMRKKAVLKFNLQPRVIWSHLTGGRLYWALFRVIRVFFPRWLVPKSWRIES